MHKIYLVQRPDKKKQTAQIMNEFILQADTKSIVQIHTVSTMQVDKNRQNKTFYKGVGAG